MSRAKFVVLASAGKYEIRKSEDGTTYCTCPGWRFSKSRPRSCKHLAGYLAVNPDRVRPAPNGRMVDGVVWVAIEDAPWLANRPTCTGTHCSAKADWVPLVDSEDEWDGRARCQVCLDAAAYAASADLVPEHRPGFVCEMNIAPPGCCRSKAAWKKGPNGASSGWRCSACLAALAATKPEPEPMGPRRPPKRPEGLLRRRETDALAAEIGALLDSF